MWGQLGRATGIAKATLSISAQKGAIMEGAKFQLGDEVQVGEIRAVFKTKSGEIRYVVEKEDGRLIIREEHELFHFDVIEETPDEEE
jgi:hypothetical protein